MLDVFKPQKAFQNKYTADLAEHRSNSS